MTQAHHAHREVIRYSERQEINHLRGLLEGERRTVNALQQLLFQAKSEVIVNQNRVGQLARQCGTLEARVVELQAELADRCCPTCDQLSDVPFSLFGHEYAELGVGD